MSSYILDASHSSIGFSVRHLMISKVHGRFASVRANLELGDAPKVSAEIDMNSVDTREEKRDGHLKSADFFDVENFPTMRFVSTGVEGATSGEFTLHGDLTLRGVTKSIALKVENLGAAKDPWGNEKIAFEARGTINRMDFGVKWNAAIEAGGVVVSEKVELVLDLQFVKQG
ncbi:MAG: YceI family protein [Myxococcales bacterium]|nr:YceI family protein [Myxococcales bacterium]